MDESRPGKIDLRGFVWLARRIERAVNWTLAINERLIVGGSLTSEDSFSRANPFNFASGPGGASVLSGLPVQAGDRVVLTLMTHGEVGENVGIDLGVDFNPNPADSFSDNFDDGLPDPAKWHDGLTVGNARLQEAGLRLEYVVPTAHVEFDQALQTFTPPLPVDKNWEATLETGIFINPTQIGQNVSIGLAFHHPTDFEKLLYVEHYVETGSGEPFRGFLASMHGSDGEGLTENLGATLGTVRLAYNAATKVITASYVEMGSMTWKFLASYGLAGSGGATGNANWDLPGSGGFRLSIEAFSEQLSIPSGLVWVDNFQFDTEQEPPRLDVRPAAGLLVLSWPASAENFQLQSRPSLQDGDWMPIPFPPMRLGDAFEVTLPISAGDEFFRLKK